MNIKSFDDYNSSKGVSLNSDKHQLSKEELQLSLKRLITQKKRAVLDYETDFADGVVYKSSIDNLLSNYRNAECALDDIRLLQQMEASLFPEE